MLQTPKRNCSSLSGRSQRRQSLPQSNSFSYEDRFPIFPTLRTLKRDILRPNSPLLVGQLIDQAYILKDKASLMLLHARSTRSVGVFWALLHQATVYQVCEAATCSSVYTFSKFYLVDIKSFADTAFSHKFLSWGILNLLLLA